MKAFKLLLATILLSLTSSTTPSSLFTTSMLYARWQRSLSCYEERDRQANGNSVVRKLFQCVLEHASQAHKWILWLLWSNTCTHCVHWGTYTTTKKPPGSLGVRVRAPNHQEAAWESRSEGTPLPAAPLCPTLTPMMQSVSRPLQACSTWCTFTSSSHSISLRVASRACHRQMDRKTYFHIHGTIHSRIPHWGQNRLTRTRACSTY